MRCNAKRRLGSLRDKIGMKVDKGIAHYFGSRLALQGYKIKVETLTYIRKYSRASRHY